MVSVEGTPHLRDGMVDLIKIVEGFHACGVAFGLRVRRSGRQLPAGRRFRQCRQTDDGDSDLRYAPHRA